MINEEELLVELNEYQKKAAKNDINTFTKIVAGAGTGKTKTISKRYVKLVNDLLSKGVENPVERILVITFTDKAAGEMKDRIFKELRNNNVKYLGQENYISTIHGFCSKFLKKHSIEANLSPNFKLGDDVELAELYNMIIQKIKYGEYYTLDFLKEVENDLGIGDISKILDKNNLIKLNVIDEIDSVFDSILPVIQQIKSLGITPAKFLSQVISDTEKFSDAIERLSLNPLGTVESNCSDWEKILKNYIYKDNFVFDVPKFKEITGKGIIIKQNHKRKPDGWSFAPGFPENIVKITETEKYLATVIAIIYALYSKYMDSMDLIDFDDMINKTIFILENNARLRKYYKNYFKHIIVDEFQDTSAAQMNLLLALLSDEKPDITVVGDRKQSIYSFRHARVENLDILQEMVEEKFGEKYENISLSTNYRSTPEVLDVVNNLTVNELKYHAETLNPSKKRNEEEKNVKISLLKGFEENAQEHKIAQAKYIASEILKVQKKDGLSFKDFAILVKSHNVSEIIENELSKYGIPAIKKVNTDYFRKPVVKNILALLSFLHNARNEKALVRILKIKHSDRSIYKLKCEVDKLLSRDEIYELNLCDKIYKCVEEGNLDSLDINKNILKTVKTLFSLNDSIIENKKSLTVLSIFKKVVREILPYTASNKEEVNIEKVNMKIFENIIVDYMKSEKYTSIKLFLDYIEKIKNDRNFELPDVYSGEIDAVNIMTIHASKGLEFPYVFVWSMTTKASQNNENKIFIETSGKYNFGLIINDNLNPKALVYKIIYKSPREKAEEIRKYYVALSRAEKYLNILSFEGFPKNNPAEYLQNLQDSMGQIVEICDVNELVLEKKPIVDNRKFLEVEQVVKAKKVQETNAEPQKMSFSKLNTFNHCQKKYLLKYSYGYPELVEKNTGSNLGSIIHNLIYNTYLNEKPFEESEIIEYLKDSSDVDMDEVKSYYKTFVDSEYSKFKQKDILAEYGFEFLYNGIVFKGDIDLVWKNSDGGIDIIDFKTNKNIEHSLPDYHKQMYIYKKAMEEQGFRVDNLYILNLKKDSIVEKVVTKENIEEAKMAIDKDIQNILSFDTQKDAQKSENNCFTCGYKYICQKF